MAINDWSDGVLCVDSDLEEYESNIQEWVSNFGSCEKWRIKAKDEIEQRLRHGLRQIEIDTDEDDVLDLISSYDPLKNPACFMTLHLLCNDLSTNSADHWATKSEMYYRKFQDSWPIALGLIHLDIDESGTIEDDEKYNVPGVTFVRGN